MRQPVSTEPSPTTLRGRDPVRVAKRLFLATRPMFFPASVLPVLLGTAWGYRAVGYADWMALGLALVAVVCVHAGANVINDVCDAISGADRDNDARIFPFTGGSRFIQNDVMAVAEMARWGAGLLAAAAAFGVLLVIDRGAAVLVFGLIGVALAVAYSAPPLRFAGRGLGEITVGVAFGVLPVVGAAWLQSDALTPGAFAVSVPVSLWVANILLINELPDLEADRKAGKRTLAVRLGRFGTGVLYLAVNAIAVAVVVGLSLSSSLSWWSAAGPLVLLALAARATWVVLHEDARVGLRSAIEHTLAIHAAGTLWLTATVAAGA